MGITLILAALFLIGCILLFLQLKYPRRNTKIMGIIFVLIPILFLLVFISPFNKM